MSDRDITRSLEGLEAALYVARGHAEDLRQDGADVLCLLAALDRVTQWISAQARPRRDPGPVTERSVIEAQAATIAELQATVKRLATEASR